MIKKCPVCKKDFEGTGKKKYCGPKCKKRYENSLRGKARPPKDGSHSLTPITLIRPEYLSGEAATYWDKVSPILIKRGHLNVLSEDAFAELCDLVQRLRDINKLINMGEEIECDQCGARMVTPANRSLLQIDDKWDNKAGTETSSFKESALSDLKRKYSKLLLDYNKQFYLTPASNRGNFGIEDPDEKSSEKDTGKERFF